MKLEKRNRITFGQVLALSFTAAWLAGCSSAGYKKSDAAAISMQSAAAEVQAEGEALDRTLSSLKELANEPGADLELPFRQFSTAVDRLAASAHRTETTGKRMAQRATQYFQTWDKNLQAMDFEHVRDVSQARMTEVTNRFAAVERRYEQCQEVMQPLIVYLKNLRIALSSDLTTAGIESLKGLVENADANAVKVQTALAALTDELTNSSARLSSVAYKNSDRTATR